MANRFFISDTHFGHTNTWAKFQNEDGSPLRPFTSTEEMDEAMVENWNRVVGEHDTVYHLGDVVISQRHLETVKRLKGKKKLIMGNHDIFKNTKYKEAGFYELVSYRVFVDDFICSHIPLHPDSISERFVANVHGHLHGNRVMRVKYPADHLFKDHTLEIDPRYFSVCVEQINFTPISYEDLKAAIKKQMDDAGYAPPKKGWGNGSAPD